MSDFFATSWTVACQAPLSMGFSRQDYWNGLPFPSSEDLPNPGIEPRSSALQADCLLSELRGSPQETETQQKRPPVGQQFFPILNVFPSTSSQNPALASRAPTLEHQEAGKLGLCLGGVCVCACTRLSIASVMSDSLRLYGL